MLIYPILTLSNVLLGPHISASNQVDNNGISARFTTTHFGTYGKLPQLTIEHDHYSNMEFSTHGIQSRFTIKLLWYLALIYHNRIMVNCSELPWNLVKNLLNISTMVLMVGYHSYHSSCIILFSPAPARARTRGSQKTPCRIPPFVISSIRMKEDVKNERNV